MRLLYFFVFICYIGCSSSSDDMPDPINEEIVTEQEMEDEDTMNSSSEDSSLYFPPIGSDTWETVSLETLEWNPQAADELITFLAENNTKACIILKDGRIVIESYFDDADATTNLPWFSAGKTLTALTLGIAEEQGFLDRNDSSSLYLGEGWTSMNPSQEEAITLWNQLTMTSGGDYTMLNWNCTDPECLSYLNDPGEFWFYHNAFYTLIQPAIENAVPFSFNDFFTQEIKTPIGMNGIWVPSGFNSIYVSNARSMARFGLLSLNRGVWEQTRLINEDYFAAMTTTSQGVNPAYGYLWWLNGKESYRTPASTELFSGPLIPNAPSDLIAGLGANDQKMYVVPSKGLVIIRMGDDTGDTLLGPSSFDNIFWEKINAVID